MHYKDGTPAKVGDVVKYRYEYDDTAKGKVGTVQIGTVIGGFPGANTCNLFVALALTVHNEGTPDRIVSAGGGQVSFTASQSEKIA